MGSVGPSSHREVREARRGDPADCFVVPQSGTPRNDKLWRRQFFRAAGGGKSIFLPDGAGWLYGEVTFGLACSRGRVHGFFRHDLPLHERVSHLRPGAPALKTPMVSSQQSLGEITFALQSFGR